MPRRRTNLRLDDFRTPDGTRWISQAKAVYWLQVHATTLWRWRGDGMPSGVLSGKVYYPVTDVRVWIKEETGSDPGPPPA